MVSILDPVKAGFHWKVFTFQGPDSRDFLHRLTTVDARHLDPGAEARWGFFLTATGKIRSAFKISCTGPESFCLELDAGADGSWERALREVIEQYTFSERQELIEQSGPVAWVLGEEPRGLDSKVRVIAHGSRDFGRPWFTIHGEWGGAPTVSREQCEQWRIEQVRPWFGSEITFESMPLELGLVDGVAQGKGCYPGQEVIERIITQGAPPRRLVRVGGPKGRPLLLLVRKGDAVIGKTIECPGLGTVMIEAASKQY